MKVLVCIREVCIREGAVVPRVSEAVGHTHPE